MDRSWTVRPSGVGAWWKPVTAGLAGLAAGLAFLFAPAAGGGALAAQDDPPSRAALRATPAADSADLLDRARGAQRRFESIRRRHLPTTFGWGSGPCDDRVGRMCWTHETGGLWTPEPEDPAVAAARAGLLSELAAIGEVISGDEWVLGQRVWYLLEAERTADALALARRCGGGAPGWWCHTLQGLALHVEGRYPAADEAFARALEGMEPERARAWDDVRVVVDREARGILEDAAERSPAEGEARARLLWRISDPLHLVPGNERRTEHLARRTVARIRSEATNPHGLSWGDDLAELLVRYGWGVGWERIPPEPGQHPPTGRVIGHEHPESRAYIPPGSVLRDPSRAPADRWVPRLTYAPSAYAPAYAPVILPMESRVVVLPRGDHALVAATWSLPPDTTYRARKAVRDEHRPPAAFEAAPLQAGLFAAAVAGDTIHAVRADGAARGVLHREVPAGSYWVSVEVLDPVLGRAGRLRRGLEIPDAAPDIARLSDLLLVGAGPLPATTEEALHRLKVDETVESGGSIVVGWELWGLGWRDEMIRYRLSLKEEGGGLLRSVGEALGVVDPHRPNVLAWDEPGPERPGASFRSVTMDIPEVDPGDYLLRLEVATSGREVLVTERRLRIVAGR